MKELIETFRNSLQVNAIDAQGKLLWLKVPKTDMEVFSDPEAVKQITEIAEKAGALSLMVTDTESQLATLTDAQLEQVGYKRSDVVQELKEL